MSDGFYIGLEVLFFRFLLCHKTGGNAENGGIKCRFWWGGRNNLCFGRKWLRNDDGYGKMVIWKVGRMYRRRNSRKE